MSIWHKADLLRQLELCDFMVKVDDVYHYKSGKDIEIVRARIREDMNHALKMLNIMTRDWAESYRKDKLAVLHEYICEFYETEDYSLGIDMLEYIRTILS